jgi:hypothetical protein
VGQAYYRLETKLVQRSNGHSAVAAAAYNAGQNILDERTGERHDYSGKQGVYQTAILTPDNSPAWATDRARLWNEAEASERRKDSQTARQFILSFSTALTAEENIALSKQFLQEEFVSKGFVADVAYHDFTGKNAHNPHAHVLIPTRALTYEGFCGFKDRSLNRKEKLAEWREKWAAIQNRYFERQGRSERVDHRSYSDRGLDITPNIHEGKAVSAIRRKIERGERTETTSLIDLNNEITSLRNELARETAALEKRKAAEQDNKPKEQRFAEAAKETVRATKPSFERVAQDVKALHQKQLAQFSLDIQAIVRGTQETVEGKPAPAPVKEEILASPPLKKGFSPDDPKDPTWRAIKRQLDALGGDGHFEVGILSHDRGKMTERTWHREQILRHDGGKMPIIGWLKSQNATGCHIYVRPARLANGDSQGVILLDDLDPVSVEELADKGLHPALVIETSYRNCQAWVKIAPRLTREESTLLAKRLARETGGDPGSASYQHYGRMAGFLNRKEKHFEEKAGQYPWIRVVEDTGRTASYASRYHQEAIADCARLAKEREEALQYRRFVQKQATDEELKRAARAFELMREASKKRYKEFDESKLDWVVVKKMAKRGYSLEAMEHALWHSPDLDNRKKGHEQDYISRTVNKVLLEPDVLEALQRRAEREQKKDDREMISQWQQYTERERGSPASSASQGQERMRRSEEGKSRNPSSDGGMKKGSDQPVTPAVNPTDVPIAPLGSLNEEQVRWLVKETLTSDRAGKQFRLAAWALTQDTCQWKQAKAEYLKELARTVQVKKTEAYSPYTDAEIGIKLRMAGFSKKTVYDTLRENSPFICYLDEDTKTRYLIKGIAPVVDNPKVNQKIAEWNQFRTREAIALSEDQREAYITERRLEELKLSITKERWQEQLMQQRQQGRGVERER